MPQDIAHKLEDIGRAVSSLTYVSASLGSGIAELRTAVSELTSRVIDVDRQGSTVLSLCM